MLLNLRTGLNLRLTSDLFRRSLIIVDTCAMRREVSLTPGAHGCAPKRLMLCSPIHDRTVTNLFVNPAANSIRSNHWGVLDVSEADVGLFST